MTELIVPILVSAAVFFLLFRRVRRLFGRQKLSVPKIVIRISLAGGIALFLIVLSSTPVIARVLAVTIGLALALGSVLTTETERVDGTWYYKPNPMFGLLVVALLLGRIANRLLAMPGTATLVDGESAWRTASIGDSIGRLLVLVLLIYFAAYYAGILSRCGTKEMGNAAD